MRHDLATFLVIPKGPAAFRRLDNKLSASSIDSVPLLSSPTHQKRGRNVSLYDRRSEVRALLVCLGYDHKGNYKRLFDVFDRLQRNDTSVYHEFTLRKRNGKLRTVHAPDEPLKSIQRRIHLRMLRKERVHRCSAAYIRKYGPVDAARKLCGDLAVLRLDIQDFFPSITEDRVAGLFRDLGIDTHWHGEKSVFMLAKLCCHNGCIVQGAPSSPAISNLICRKLDAQLERLAASWGLRYLRYSDDMFFYSSSEFNGRKLTETAQRIITQHGFELNTQKTRYFAPGAPRRLLGLNTMGETPRIPRTKLRTMRAAFNKAARDPLANREALPRLQGLAGWYKQVHGLDERCREYLQVIRELRRPIALVKIREWLRSHGLLSRLQTR